MKDVRKVIVIWLLWVLYSRPPKKSITDVTKRLGGKKSDPASKRFSWVSEAFEMNTKKAITIDT